ncbi:MAG TPA: hypothetical protein VEA60_07590 [Allosphingosinicella sp.]|nr:hypothetical protein [Allosphingosinicella sp.]
MLLLLLLSAAVPAPPAEPLAGRLRAAVWKDLGLNALLDGGNWIGARWYDAVPDAENSPDLLVRDLACRGRGRPRCAFTLARSGGPAPGTADEPPRRLACEARFARDGAGWLVRHRPAPGIPDRTCIPIQT